MNIEQKIKQNIPLAPFSTFKIGGSAKYFIEAKEKNELLEAVKWAEEKKEKIFILAGGSNLLIKEPLVDGLVIKMGNKNYKVMGERVECGAGASLAKIASLTISHDLTGLEWSVGIPGATIGGAARGNAEAFGVAMSDIIENIEVLDKTRLKFSMLSNRDCEFRYRFSVFKEQENYIIWSVILRLKKEKAEAIQNLVKQSLEFRINKYPKLPSAGSIFKNIPISEVKEKNPKLAEEAIEKSTARLENVGAGFIIDRLGLKGKKIGGAKVSLEHANHIVNTGNATASDVAMLIGFIKQQTRDKFGIQLHEEIQYFGF